MSAEAVVRDQDGQVRKVAVPLPSMDNDSVLLAVEAIGLCRTDLYAARGEIPTRSGRLVLGHEFAGCALEVGRNVQHVSAGQRVAVNPLIPCGSCVSCSRRLIHQCQRTQFMGVDCDGACSTQLIVPGHLAHTVPVDLSAEETAFAEPVAATLAVLKAEIHPRQSGIVVGEGRIAALTCKVLASAGFPQIVAASFDELDSLPSDRFDFAIETAASSQLIRQLIRVIRPRGRIVLKSRQFQSISLCVRDFIGKEPIFETVHYGPFDEAVRMLSERRIDVSDLVGSRYPLAEFSAAFAKAERSEFRKTFLIPGD